MQNYPLVESILYIDADIKNNKSASSIINSFEHTIFRSIYASEEEKKLVEIAKEFYVLLDVHDTKLGQIKEFIDFCYLIGFELIFK